MNFKNITKIAAVTLLFAGIPAFAVIQENPEMPVYLHIKNNTAYDFNISQSQAMLGIPLTVGAVKAHDSQAFTQLPWSFGGLGMVGAAFSLDDSSGTIRFYASLKTSQTTPETIEVSTSLRENLVPIGDIDKSQTEIKPAADNKYHLFITLAGNKENKFAGSSIKVEVESKLAEQFAKERGRLEQRLPGQPAETSLERLLQMKRQ